MFYVHKLEFYAATVEKWTDLLLENDYVDRQRAGLLVLEVLSVSLVPW